MNDTQITFCGWVGSDISLAEIASGTPVATFRVGSTPRRFRAGRWEDGPTAWFTVKAWRALAEQVHRSVRNGDPVIVQGRLVADVWVKGDGTTSTRYVVVATAVGHDLNRGTSDFTKSPRREATPGADDVQVKEVIHSYDKAGPALDSDGEVVSPAAQASPIQPAA